MNNIYLLAFNGGSGGDFLCSQISKDSNFYPLEYKINPITNTYDLENPFAKWNLNTKNQFMQDLLVTTDNTLENIDLHYNEKNLIAPIHFFGDHNQAYLDALYRLPRLKVIRLYSNKLPPLFYLLLWIKRWVFAQEFENKEIFIREHISIYTSKFHISTRNKILDSIFANRNYYYAFEISAMENLFNNSINFVKNFFKRYNYYNTIVQNNTVGWIPYNIDNLYLDPINNSEEFCQLFNMEKSINPEIISNYYLKNLQVIEEIFGEPYEVFILGDWLSKLTEWVQIQCPNAYSVDFKIL
jgi:hypothetical protein